MFLLYINDINDIILSSVYLFADDCILYRVIKSPEDYHYLQQVTLSNNLQYKDNFGANPAGWQLHITNCLVTNTYGYNY